MGHNPDKVLKKYNKPSGEGGEAPVAKSTPSSVGGGSRESRRRFLKAGLIGVPMIVTLRSQPARALTSLGSAGIMYGMYNDEGKAINKDGEVLVDPTRRSDAVVPQSSPAPMQKRSRTGMKKRSRTY